MILEACLIASLMISSVSANYGDDFSDDDFYLLVRSHGAAGRAMGELVKAYAPAAGAAAFSTILLRGVPNSPAISAGIGAAVQKYLEDKAEKYKAWTKWLVGPDHQVNLQNQWETLSWDKFQKLQREYPAKFNPKDGKKKKEEEKEAQCGGSPADHGL